MNEQENTSRGRVTLIGAGPGDPELLTLAGARALAEADLVIYDRLVNPALLDHAPNAERVCIGKRPGEPHEPAQNRINTLIIEEGLAGKHVVRLKGGDPFMFGRGGEELAAARSAGIEVRVIPGITAALGAAAACQLPLTQRKLAASVAFVTGCPAADSPRPGIDWRSLGRCVDTIVLYMSVRHVAEIARELIESGRTGDHPAAAIVKATTAEQSLHYFTLAELGCGLAEDSVEAPAIFIVGEVVKFHRELLALAREAEARI